MKGLSEYVAQVRQKRDFHPTDDEKRAFRADLDRAVMERLATEELEEERVVGASGE